MSTPQKVAKFCWSCGKPIKANQVYCTYCGKRLSAAPQNTTGNVNVSTPVSQSPTSLTPQPSSPPNNTPAKPPIENPTPISPVVES